MAEIYKLTNSSKWKYFYKILLVTFLFHAFGGIVLLFYKNVKEIDLFLKVLLMILLGWFVLFALPTFLLYFNHKKRSKDVILNQNKGLFTYVDSSKVSEFKLAEIEKIELYLSPPSYDKRLDIMYFGIYNYTVFYIKNGDVIDISCLVFDQTEEVFSEKLIGRKKKSFPFMKK